MLSLKNISKEFNKEKVLKDISLEIKENEFITIMGPSGGGKSTLLQVLSLLTEPSEGEVWFGNSKINFKKEKNLNLIRRENISMVFQNANLISSLNVLENILIATNTNESYKDKVTRIKNLLDEVGLSKKYDSSVTSLSGGEAQRVSIARALINKPKLILCDEPTGALDSKNTKKIMQLLLDIQKENKTTLVIVTHDKEIGELGERKIFLRDGELYEVANNF